MTEKALEKLLAEGLPHERITDTISVSLTWSTTFPGLKWCVVQSYLYRYPKWMFWKKKHEHCQIYGPFPSRNQAVKYARYLSTPI